MPVTHGVTGSSPVRTATKEETIRVSSFFISSVSAARARGFIETLLNSKVTTILFGLIVSLCPGALV